MPVFLFELNSITVAALSMAVFATLKWLYERHFHFNRLINKIPGPPSYPIIGSSLEIKGGYEGTLETLQLVWPEKYGEIHRWFVGGQCNVSLSSPELVEPILTSQTILDKGVDYEWYRQWLGNGLLISKGSTWKPRRRLLTPAFHFKILDDFIDVFNAQSKVMCDLLDELCKPEDENKRLIDVYPMLTRCTLDIICETAMGTKMNAQTTEDSEYANCVHRMTQIISERTTKPWLASDIIFPFTPTGREHNKMLSTLHSFTDNVITNRRKFLNNNKLNEMESKNRDDDEMPKKIRKSLLDLLITIADDPANELTDKDLRQEIDTFAFGGHDTTSAAMTWFLYCMAANPECQERVWEELQDTFGDSDRPCTMEDLSSLKYMDCCIKETLRLYPSAPLIERMATEDVKIGDYIIPAGVNILILIYGMHRNPRLFPEPSVFNPERFFPEQSVGRHPYAYIPFSAGPRNCIGQRFALIEERVVLSNLLRRFKFSLSPLSEAPIPSYQVVLKPLHGMNLIVTRR